MIRIFCQYSYGGFKTFHLNGVTHEPMNEIVSPEKDYGFPELASHYYNQGGLKLLYRYLDEGQLTLIVKEIPGLNKDTDGRPISSAVQFIGDAADREQLDRLAILIANNLKRFEDEFANMFDLRGGLFFDGDKLQSWIDRCAEPCGYSGDSGLLQIRGRKGTVLLFVPFSERFGNDQQVTDKLLRELRLPQEAAQEDRFVRMSDLLKIQGHIAAIPAKTPASGQGLNPDEIDAQQFHEMMRQNSHLRKALSEAEAQMALQASKHVRDIRRVSFICLAAFLLLFIFSVSGCTTISWLVSLIFVLATGYQTYNMFKK